MLQPQLRLTGIFVAMRIRFVIQKARLDLGQMENIFIIDFQTAHSTMEQDRNAATHFLEAIQHPEKKNNVGQM